MQKCRRSKSRTFTVVILFLFEGNKTHFSLKINSTDKGVLVGRSNNAGVRAPDAEAIFTFFLQNTHF